MKLHCIFVLAFLMLSGHAYSQMPPIEPGVSHELAIWRAARYSDVRYKLNLTLEKMSPVLKGTIEIRVNVGSQAETRPLGSVPDVPIILDWRKIRGSESLSTISNVSINGVASVLSSGLSGPSAEQGPPEGGTQNAYEESNEHLIFRQGVKAGENVIKLDFTSPILTSGSAITRYVDKEDGAEYLYSLFVPSDASTAFPVFDQPDLKARFTLQLNVPASWTTPISNTRLASMLNGRCLSSLLKDGTECLIGYSFEETKPISTYVFAFAAGPWERVSVPPAVAGGLTQPRDASGNISGRNAATKTDGSKGQLQPPATAGGTDLSTHFYVRRSQSAKFKPHAAEVFRLNREGIKYLEEYFDYKFPFPKYDIVLIPEFPFGGMEHAGATFLRESSIIFPSEPTANDYISRANVIFHEAAHQWFGDTVTMRWFDDLWLKEGFAEFMAYKTLERVMPQYNAWKAFYERNKQAAYLTDSTKGTTAIYQPIENLSAAKSAYGNIVYRKAPSFLRQAEFYLGPGKFQTAVRAFLKKHEFGNAEWTDLVKEFQESAWLRDELGYKNSNAEDRQKYEEASKATIGHILDIWVKTRGVPIVRVSWNTRESGISFRQTDKLNDKWSADLWTQYFNVLFRYSDGRKVVKRQFLDFEGEEVEYSELDASGEPVLVFPNYQDYGYGIFLLDDKSREYVLKNIQNEKDDFLRSMMWGAPWDSVREAELDPREYVELAIRNLPTEKDEMITASVLNRVSTTMTYYIPSGPDKSVPPAVAGGAVPARPKSNADDMDTRLEKLLIEKMRTATAPGQRITFYRAFLNIASTENARRVLKEMLRTGGNLSGSEGALQAKSLTGTLPTGRVSAIPLKTKDKFDIVTKLAILNDPEAPQLLAELDKTETSDDAKRYAYAARAAFPTKENREKYWKDFTANKDISESWIEAAMNPFNSPRHSELSLPYLERALKELPNLKRNRKIFFVNGWLGAFIGGQKSKQALDMVNNFLADNPSLDRDLRLKILENVDVIERAVKIRGKFN